MRLLGRRLVAVILLITMILSLSACSFVRGIDISSTTNISIQELSRLIVNAVKNEKNVSDSYSGIPENQRNGVSYSYFSAFCDILREMNTKSGEIESFTILNSSNKAEYLNNLMEKSGCTYDVLKAYGNVSVVEIMYSNAKKNANKCRFFVSQDNEGNAYLSGNYVTDFISAYNYFKHYFSMVDERNTDGITALLKPQLSEDIYINPVMEAKAEAVAEYYNLKVKSKKEEFVFDVVTPFYIEVTIPETIAEDGISVIPHKVSIVKDNDSYYRIDDKIPLDTNNSGINIYKFEESKLFDMNTIFTDQILYATLGTPYYINVREMTDNVETDHTLYVKAYYVNMILTIYADKADDCQWKGEIASVSLFKDTYSINKEIYAGMSVSELLLIYPMLDEYDYKYTYSDAEKSCDITFSYDEMSNVDKILINKIN